MRPVGVCIDYQQRERVMIYQIYRLTLDENGQEDCSDFTNMSDAEIAFKKATRRKGVFSADVQAYSAKAPFQRLGGKIYSFQRAD
jgi:hypothetical protein